MAQYLQGASHGVVAFFPLTVGACRHFLQQNAAIRSGTASGVTINLNVLGIGNGITVTYGAQ